MRYAVETWAPDYGAPAGDDSLVEATAPVDITVERPPERWDPIRPANAPPIDDVLFVDGVRRVDARVWISAGKAVHQGLCASWAAGAVRCNGDARIDEVRVGRGLFAGAPDLAPIATVHGTWDVHQVPDNGDPVLALQGAMGSAEAEVAAACRDRGSLVVVDGPLRVDRRIPGAVGYVKTHHVAYLPGAVAEIVPRLAPGERTPLFVTGDRFARFCWYLRLPGGGDHGWAGVVRCETVADRPVPAAADLADGLTTLLPRFASVRHKDPRAPQNLVPIGGLEKLLRRRLGDARLLERSLRLAASEQ